MYGYAVNITFYAGSRAEEDTDRALVFIKTPNPITKEELKERLDRADAICNSYVDSYGNKLEEYDFDAVRKYDNGHNVDTLLDYFLVMYPDIEFASTPLFVNNAYEIEVGD